MNELEFMLLSGSFEYDTLDIEQQREFNQFFNPENQEACK